MTAEREPIGTEVVRDLLLLCGVSVPVEIVAAQTPGDRDGAARWAASVHLRASDNDDVEEQPRPAWLSLFEMLDGYAEPVSVAGDRWAGHMAERERADYDRADDEEITVALAEGVVMAQQIMIARMRERMAAALATATAGRNSNSPEWVVNQMTRDLLGTDEAWAEFTARFGGGQEQEGERP